MHSDLAFFHDNHAGALVSRFINDAQILRKAVSDVFTGLGKDVLTLVFLLAVMIAQDPILAAISVFVFPAASYPIARIGKRMRRVSGNMQSAMGEFTALLDVSCASATECTAVGVAVVAGTSRRMVSRSGATWSLVPTPLPTGTETSGLLGSSCTTATCPQSGP